MRTHPGHVLTVQSTPLGDCVNNESHQILLGGFLVMSSKPPGPQTYSDLGQVLLPGVADGVDQHSLGLSHILISGLVFISHLCLHQDPGRFPFLLNREWSHVLHPPSSILSFFLLSFPDVDALHHGGAGGDSLRTCARVHACTHACTRGKSAFVQHLKFC